MRLAGPLDFGAGAVRTHPPSSLDSQRPGSAQGGFATRSATVAKAQRISNATDARGLDICPTRNECSVVLGCKLSGYKWDPYQLESMKRQALLVIGALVATVLALTPTVAAWYETPVVWASYQNEGGGGYNYGGSTKYGYSGPATDTHPQFYAGAETHTVCNTWGGVCYYAHDVKVTVTGVDPAGATLSGDRFTSLSALHSPSGGTYEEVMNFIYQTLSNAVPYGIGSDIAYLADSQPTGYDSTSAWGQWTACPVFCYPADAGLRFGFQIAVDPGLIRFGSRIYIPYYRHVRGATGWFTANDTGGAINGRHVDVYRAPPSDPSDGGRSLTGQRVLIVPPGGRIPRGVPPPSGGGGASGTSGSGHTPSGGTSAR